MKGFDLFPNSIEQSCQKEPNKYFVWFNDPRIKAEDRRWGLLVPEVYEEFLLEIIVNLSSEDRKVFLQKHYYSYEDRNIGWFNKLKELIENIELSEKEIFIELINQHLEELESIKYLNFNEQCIHVLRKLSESNSFAVNIGAILGVEKANSNDVGQYLKNMGYVRLYAQGLAEILPKGKSFLAQVETIEKPVKDTIRNLQKQVDDIKKDDFDFLDWCDKTSRYLDFANEHETIRIIEKHKKNINNISINDFKLDMLKRITDIIDSIKEYKRLRTINNTIMNQENNINNSGNISIVNGNENTVTQTNNITNTKLSENELKKIITEAIEALKTDLPNLKLEDDEVEELKKQIEELESLQEAPLTKKSSWKLGTIKDILKGAAGGALGDMITQHAGKIGAAITALSQWFGQG